MTQFVDLTGQTFGRLRAVERTGKQGRRSAYWRCVCECGGEKVVQGSDLRRGATSSCGCLRRERLLESKTKHGCTGRPEYGAFVATVSRCYNPSNAGYPHYGGRGIRVSSRWYDEQNHVYRPDVFLDDVGPRPGKSYSLDRINNDGDYEPGNVRWATRTEQNLNRRPLANLVELGAARARIAELEAENSRLREGLLSQSLDPTPVVR